MGIFTRFMDIVNSNINALLDKAEDPEKMLKLMIQEMEDTLIELKSSCAARMADEIRNNKKINEAAAYVERWHNRALLALSKGKEDLAREALVEKKNAQEGLDKLRESNESLSQSINESKTEIKTLEDKINQAKIRLKALQEKEAKTEESRRTKDDLNKRFSEMEDRINRKDAWNSLNKKESTVEDKFAQMELDREIENELENLKREAGL